MKARGAYERLVRQLLFTLEPERAHDLAIWSLQRAAKFALARRSLHAFRPGPRPRTVFGITFPHPVGLAAGFDKNGLALPAWAALGFGFVEIGTVTAKAQPGNAKPRIFRLPQQEALINRLGFNNDGADVVAERLQIKSDAARGRRRRLRLFFREALSACRLHRAQRQFTEHARSAFLAGRRIAFGFIAQCRGSESTLAQASLSQDLAGPLAG